MVVVSLSFTLIPMIYYIKMLKFETIEYTFFLHDCHISKTKYIHYAVITI